MSAPLAFAGDWHGNTTWALDTIDALAGNGVREIVHCGDFGLWPSVDGQRYLRSVVRSLSERDMLLRLIPGNHDDWDWVDRLRANQRGVAVLVRGGRQEGPPAPRIVIASRGARWSWQGLTFAALGGAVSVDRGPESAGRGWWPQEAATLGDVRRLAADGPVDVLVCHDRPSAAVLPELAATRRLWPEDRLRAADGHRELLQAAVDAVQPQLLVHGHYHDIPGYQGRDEMIHMGYGPARVIGLDRDGTTLGRNTWLLTLGALR